MAGPSAQQPRPCPELHEAMAGPCPGISPELLTDSGGMLVALWLGMAVSHAPA